MAECEFCGSDATLSAEHAWPDWALSFVREAYKGPHRIWGTRRGEKLLFHGPAPELRVRILCDTCNHHRLGLLESEMAELLKPLIRGDPQVVPKSRLPSMALWVVKTAMVFELATTGESMPFFTRSERRGLALESAIPDRTTVAVAGFGDAEPTAFAFGATVPISPSDGGPDYEALTMTLSIGQFVAQVVADHDPRKPEMVGDPVHPLKPIWPPRTNLLWPPRVFLDYEGLRMVATIGSGVPMFERPP